VDADLQAHLGQRIQVDDHFQADHWPRTRILKVQKDLFTIRILKEQPASSRIGFDGDPGPDLQSEPTEPPIPPDLLSSA